MKYGHATMDFVLRIGDLYVINLIFGEKQWKCSSLREWPFMEIDPLYLVQRGGAAETPGKVHTTE